MNLQWRTLSAVALLVLCSTLHAGNDLPDSDSTRWRIPSNSASPTEIEWVSRSNRRTYRIKHENCDSVLSSHLLALTGWQSSENSRSPKFDSANVQFL